MTNDEHFASLADQVREHVDGVDGVLHSIAFAPPSCLGGDFLDAPWSDVATALQVSAYSLKSLAVATLPLFGDSGGSVVGMTFDATVAWPAYDWMGVAKAGLESTARYLARELGPRKIRVNLVAAGPLRTMAAKSIPGFVTFEDAWDGRAPLGWDNSDAEPVARGVAVLLSDWLPATTGRNRPRRRRLPRDGRLIGRLRRAVAAVLRRPGGPRRGPAVPAQRDPRPRRPR